MASTALIAIIIVAIVGILAAYWVYANYSTILIGDPKAALLNYGEMYKNTNNLKLSYSIKFPMYESILSGMQMTMDYYKLNDDTKMVMETSGSLTTGQTIAYYNINNKTVVCTENSLLMQGNSIECQIQTTSTTVFPQVDQSFLDKTDIEYKGIKTIAGRMCDDFEISINMSQINSLENQVPSIFSGYATAMNIAPITPNPNETYIMFEMCMDKAIGYPALMSFSYIQYSSLSGKTTETEIMSFEVTSMATDVKESDMKIPVNFVLDDSECTQNTLDFDLIAFNEIPSPRLDVTLYKSYSTSGNITISKSMSTLEAFKTYPVNMSFTQQIPSSGYYNVKVCIGSECQTDYCYMSSYSTYNYSYNYCTSHSWCYASYSTGCCLGQCNLSTYECISSPQSSDYTSYGQDYYCTNGQTCGTDCKCH